MSLAKTMSVHSCTESTHVTDHSDVETLESCSSRPLSPCRARTAGMDGEIVANVVVKGSFLDLDDQCLMRQYRKLRRVMSDSILVGVLDVPEVYEPGRFSNDVEKTRPKAQQTPPEQEKPPVPQPKTSRIQAKAKAKGEVQEVQRTTVMLRNLPNNYTRDMFLSLLDEEGLSELYDFVYLPMDFCRDANLGYAFVNLVNGAAVDQVWKTFNGFDRWALPTAKVCQVGWSGPHQGFLAHVERYRNSPVMHKSVPDCYKPMIFKNGVRKPFPRPTKKVKALGNEEFRKGAFEAALENYAMALQNLQRLAFVECALSSQLASNQALCFLKLAKFQEAEERASAALVADASNSKAVYRRALARLKLGEPRAAMEDLQKASRLEPQNAEIRQKLAEAKELADAVPMNEAEVAVCAATASVLGKDGGLYNEKPDLNEGRLAESHQEQREWVRSIEKWSDITDVSFADEENKNTISVYMALPGIHEIAANKVCVWMTMTSLEVRIIDLQGTNWCYVAQELWGQINPERSSWKIRKDKLSLKLDKREPKQFAASFTPPSHDADTQRMLLTHWRLGYAHLDLGKIEKSHRATGALGPSPGARRSSLSRSEWTRDDARDDLHLALRWSPAAGLPGFCLVLSDHNAMAKDAMGAPALAQRTILAVRPDGKLGSMEVPVRGISVEPLRSYFEQLPVADGKLLLNVAISNHDGFEDLYFVRPQLVEASSSASPALTSDIVRAGLSELLAWLDDRSFDHEILQVVALGKARDFWRQALDEQAALFAESQQLHDAADRCRMTGVEVATCWRDGETRLGASGAIATELRTLRREEGLDLPAAPAAPPLPAPATAEKEVSKEVPTQLDEELAVLESVTSLPGSMRTSLATETIPLDSVQVTPGGAEANGAGEAVAAWESPAVVPEVGLTGVCPEGCCAEDFADVSLVTFPEAVEVLLEQSQLDAGCETVEDQNPLSCGAQDRNEVPTDRCEEGTQHLQETVLLEGREQGRGCQESQEEQSPANSAVPSLSGYQAAAAEKPATPAAPAPPVLTAEDEAVTGLRRRGGVEVVIDSPVGERETAFRPDSPGWKWGGDGIGGDWEMCASAEPPLSGRRPPKAVRAATPAGTTEENDKLICRGQKAGTPVRRRHSAHKAVPHAVEPRRSSSLMGRRPGSVGMQSNRKLVRNALEHCLKGDANREQREQVLKSFDEELVEYERFILLFRSIHTGRHDLRALYGFSEGTWTRLLQLLPSPASLEERMVTQCLRYDSGGKDCALDPATNCRVNSRKCLHRKRRCLLPMRSVPQSLDAGPLAPLALSPITSLTSLGAASWRAALYYHDRRPPSGGITPDQVFYPDLAAFSAVPDIS
ncbi:unnamed protein product [Cladocopium goreaui]|uniref:Protein MEI2-like 4 (OML4) (MEI2-like protein 4) n=1 Tax=Cladocopium goreaui TaxID=2562237 RepID=A0A9P1C5Z5_9DINO|nr:unnamed protein product [Cladocopium goreaui]